MMTNSRTKDFKVCLPYEAPRIEVIEIEPSVVLCVSNAKGAGNNKLNKYDIII